ncbi:hypothetical protein [Streptomyces albidoflavus]|uniref:hypothetical protein n=1 Tax=Streptomyces albidoflavus TaxID=1886 RepID=UPI0033F4B329
MDPMIIEPQDSGRRADPERGRYLLHDAHFPIDARHEVADGHPPLRTPHFPIGDLGPWVFGKNPEWMRRRFKLDRPLLLQGEPLRIRHLVGGRRSERRLTLADIERLAWALHERGDIDGIQLQRASQILVAVATQYVGPTLLEHQP